MTAADDPVAYPDGDFFDGAGDDDFPRSHRRKPRIMFLVVGLVAAALLAFSLFSTIGVTPGSDAPHAGSAVPTFSLAAVPGYGHGRVGVPADGGGSGHPAILLFFASWCTPCRAEVPALAAVYRHQQADRSRLAKVAVIGVDGNDPASNAESFLASADATFPVGADSTFAVTQGQFAFDGLPEAVFVEADGTIAGIHRGALSAATFRSWEARLLAR